MYDELIKRLRGSTDWRSEEKCDGCPYEEDYPCCVDCLEKMHGQAADAIEELWKKYLASEVDATNLTGWLAEEHAKHLWIPMTERLPEIMHTVIVSGRMKDEWETDFFRFVDAATYTDGEFFETFNDWYEGQDEFEITHWMPLPESPEEEL